MPQGSAPQEQIAQFRSDGFNAQSGLRVALYTENFDRTNISVPVRIINQIVESTPLREESVYRAQVGLRELHYSRPGLVYFTTYGVGPIRGLMIVQRLGPTLVPITFAVSGSRFFRDGGDFGPCPGVDLVRFAASSSQIVAVASGVAYIYDGITYPVFTPIPSAILPPVSDVAYLAGRFVFTCNGSDTFYYSAINDATNIGGLNFATAESYPDANVAVGVLNEELVFFGATSVEFWQVTADANSPFQPVTGRGFQRGCAARGSVAFVDNSLFWVAENRVVYRAGPDAPHRISTSTIEDKLRQCVNVVGITAWGATFEGHEIYLLNIPGIGSYAYDASRIGTREADRGEWSEWQSWNRANFRGQVATVLNDVTYVGDDTTGTVWAFTVGAYTDGPDPLVRLASGFIKVEEGTPRCNNLVLHGVVGVGNAVNPAALPIVEMRYSDDEGRTFVDWRAASLGRQGATFSRVYWTRLDSMRSPGRLIEFRCSDPVNFVVSHVELNATRPAI